MMVLHKTLLLMLHLLHITIIIFCVIGWLLPPARPWHLMLCAMIFASWFGLGVWKGWGYCLLTDLQWRLMRRTGEPTPSFGYVPMLWQRITGREVDPQYVDQVTEGIFYFSALASLWVNWSWLQTLIL